jgi:hypothetical protein
MKHILQQPFVFATGIAALIHSTWSLGTFFAGEQPDGLHLWGWLIPALLIAFALDIGQIVTSTEIREYGLTVARAITFLIFALATYYLQWLYIAHHMPSMPLSDGISPSMQGVATQLRDLALWIIPALMPLSTLLYTFSSDKKPTVKAKNERHSITEEIVVETLEEKLPTPKSESLLLNGVGNRKQTKKCEHCGTSYQSRNKNSRFCSNSCRVSSHKKSQATSVSEVMQ